MGSFFSRSRHCSENFRDSVVCVACYVFVHCDVGLGDFERDALNAHNEYRKKHGAAPLSWSRRAERMAQDWADHLASEKRLEHGNHSGMGQNLGYVFGQEMTGQAVTDMWYDEFKDYDFNKGQFTATTGHFTQLVWRSTTEMGIARATASDGSVYAVCNYVPAGNVLGQFDKNVRPAT